MSCATKNTPRRFLTYVAFYRAGFQIGPRPPFPSRYSSSSLQAAASSRHLGIPPRSPPASPDAHGRRRCPMQLRARPSLRDASLGLSPRCYASKLAVRSLLTISSPGALPHHPRPSAWRVASRLSCIPSSGVTTVRHGDRDSGGPRGRDAYAAVDSDDGEGDALARARGARPVERRGRGQARREHPRATVN